MHADEFHRLNTSVPSASRSKKQNITSTSEALSTLSSTVYPFPPLSTKVTTILTSTACVNFGISCTLHNGTIQYEIFCVCLFSPNLIHVKLIISFVVVDHLLFIAV